MTEIAWQIYKSDGIGEPVEAGAVGSLASAVRRITEIEAMPVDSLTFQVHVAANARSDAEALDYLEWKGRHALYIIIRVED